MKQLILLLLSLLSFTILAQESQKTDNQFVRIYNNAGVKIQKGNIIGISDSSITVHRSYGTYTVNYLDIGFIKTKRSFGHRLGSITGVTAACLALSGYRIGGNDTPSSLGVSSLINGGIIAAIVQLFTKIEKTTIDRNLNAWLKFKEKHQVIEEKKEQPKTSIWA